MVRFYARMLTVDPTDQSFEIETPAEQTSGEVPSGKGLATYLLLAKNLVGVDPVSADNHLILATGPVCQSRLWASCRYGVFTKAPLTGFHSEFYSSGKVPEAMDAAGSFVPCTIWQIADCFFLDTPGGLPYDPRPKKKVFITLPPIAAIFIPDKETLDIIEKKPGIKGRCITFKDVGVLEEATAMEKQT